MKNDAICGSHYLPDDSYDSETQMSLIEAYLQSESNKIRTVQSSSRGLYFSDQVMNDYKLNKGLKFNVSSAYNDQNKPNFLDSEGNLIEGIYLGMENEVYHSLDAISSSQIKKYAKSPSHYYRAYVENVNRKRTLPRSTEITFDTGTYTHELILEKEGFYDRYFKLLNAAEHEDCIHTATALKEKCKELSLASSGSKPSLIKRIIEHDPTVKIFDNEQYKHICKNAGQKAVEKAEYVISNSIEKTSLIDALKHKSVKPLLLKTPIDPVVWDDAHRAEQTVRNNSWANDILQSGFAEVSVIVRCPETGRMLKVRIDWLSRNGVPADVKTTRSADPLKAVFQFADLSYDLQAYMYSYCARLAGIPSPEKIFPFITVEMAEADICEVFELSDEDWIIAERNFHKHIRNLDQSIKNDDWAGYTKRDGSTLLRLSKRGRV